jgi:transposase-like protein
MLFHMRVNVSSSTSCAWCNTDREAEKLGLVASSWANWKIAACDPCRRTWVVKTGKAADHCFFFFLLLWPIGFGADEQSWLFESLIT